MDLGKLFFSQEKHNLEQQGLFFYKNFFYNDIILIIMTTFKYLLLRTYLIKILVDCNDIRDLS
jgi:hypothetical protein